MAQMKAYRYHADEEMQLLVQYFSPSQTIFKNFDVFHTEVRTKFCSHLWKCEKWCPSDMGCTICHWHCYWHYNDNVNDIVIDIIIDIVIDCHFVIYVFAFVFDIMPCDAFDIVGFDVVAFDVVAFDIESDDVKSDDVKSDDVKSDNVRSLLVMIYTICLVRDTQ